MADLKISQLTAKTALTGNEEFPINDGGTTKKVAASNLLVQSYLGYNTAGGTTDVVGAGTYKNFAKQITTSGAGLLASIDAYVKGNAANAQSINVALLADNAGAPGNLIAALGGETTTSVVINHVVMNTTARWLSIPISVWLPAGTYWLLVHGGNQLTMHYDASGSDQTATGGATWNYDTSQNNAFTNSTRNYSIRGSLIQ